MKATYTIEQYGDLMARTRRHFPNLCYLANLDSGATAGPLINDDGTVEALSILWGDNNVSHELLGICGCGNPDEVARLFLAALRAIEKKDRVVNAGVDESGGSLESAMVAHIKKLADTLCKDWVDFVNGREVNTTRLKFCNNETLEALVLYDLDKMGWTEHGTSIYCSWLTEKGRPLWS